MQVAVWRTLANEDRVVRFYGAYTRQPGPFLVLSELMKGLVAVTWFEQVLNVVLVGGKLVDVLHPEDMGGAPPLSLLERLQMAYEIAEALLQLHTHHPPVIHGDVSPYNV